MAEQAKVGSATVTLTQRQNGVEVSVSSENPAWACEVFDKLAARYRSAQGYRSGGATSTRIAQLRARKAKMEAELAAAGAVDE